MLTCAHSDDASLLIRPSPKSTRASTSLKRCVPSSRTSQLLRGRQAKPKNTATCSSTCTRTRCAARARPSTCTGRSAVGSTGGTGCRGRALSARTGTQTSWAATLTRAASRGAETRSLRGTTAILKRTTATGRTRTAVQGLAALRAVCRPPSARSSGRSGSGPSKRSMMIVSRQMTLLDDSLDDSLDRCCLIETNKSCDSLLTAKGTVVKRSLLL